MLVFIWGFLAGAVSVCLAIGWFVSWAIAGAEKSIEHDLKPADKDLI